MSTLSKAVAPASPAKPQHTPEDRAVMLHLVRLIQDSPDVRYYVGGAHTQMRTLLLAAIKASGFDGDPLEALLPAEHRRDDLPERERLLRRIEEMER